MEIKNVECEICHKIIKGLSEAQLNYLLQQHKLAKHPEEFLEKEK